MNIVRAKVAAHGALVTFDGGVTLAAPPSFIRAAGRNVLLGLRPEHIGPAPEGAPDAVPSETSSSSRWGRNTLALDALETWN